jgi:hypothetical protein
MDLDELERLLEQATPGPWELGKEGGGFWRRGYRPINAPDHHAVFEAVVRMEGENANDPQLEANAALIAALRNHAEELVRDARRYRELVMAVGNKWPDETRHETALRYIRTAEVANRGGQAAIAKEQP